MIHFERHTLANGLQVIAHYDPSHLMVVTNLLYKVGSAHEQPNRTGIAHLFEHLMFTGTKKAPRYDDVINGYGGTNNAFTSSDITNYYNVMPFFAWQEGLWLEADRMQNLSLGSDSIDIQKKVVIEEFKERYLNVPYGTKWHHIRQKIYQNHGYAWPTIGMNIEHIKETTEAELKDFYTTHYAPNNAVLSIGGNIKPEIIFKEAERLFSGIKSSTIHTLESSTSIFREFPQMHILEEKVPFESVQLVFPMCDRFDPQYIIYDIITEILSNGKASILYQDLVKQQELLVGVSNYISGSIYPGMFVIDAKIKKGISIEKSIQSILNSCKKIINSPSLEMLLNRAKTKVESALTFQDVDLQNRVFNLAYAESSKNIEFFEQEKKHYLEISVQEVRDLASALFEGGKYAQFRTHVLN